MKPGEHPDFFRVAPPPGTSRESTIVLDREGRFWHDGARVEHAPLERALRGWIARHPDDGRPILTNGYDWCYFRAEDTPLFVDAVKADGDRVTLVLFDGSEELLDPSTLSLDDEGVVVTRARGLEARFTRHAQTSLAPLLDGDPPELVLGGARFPFRARQKAPASPAVAPPGT